MLGSIYLLKLCSEEGKLGTVDNNMTFIRVKQKSLHL